MKVDTYKANDNLKYFYKELYVDNHVPFCIERVSDHAILLMNDDFKSYSFIDKSFTERVSVSRYSFRRLFDDDRVENGSFKIIGWAPIDNLFDHPEQYFTLESQKIKKDGR